MNEIIPHVVEGVICDENAGPAAKPVNWLKQAVSRGLQALVVLHLDGGPSAETVTQTASVWYRVLKTWPIDWNEELDRQRLTDAFLALAGQSRRWPSPSQLRALLPSRVYPQPTLAAPDYPPEKAKANLIRIRAMIKTAFKEQRKTV